MYTVPLSSNNEYSDHVCTPPKRQCPSTPTRAGKKLSESAHISRATASVLTYTFFPVSDHNS